VKLQNKAARVGFDWPSIEPVFAKLEEEIAELKEVARPGDEAAAEELGDLLFVVANIARHLKIDPEHALRLANDKFERRFRAVEARLTDAGLSAADSTLEEMDLVWTEVKRAERGSED
jgi:uncharacterized protein YabN with tetrapyrrole methylase and pyrophosphatase domain